MEPLMGSLASVLRARISIFVTAAAGDFLFFPFLPVPFFPIFLIAARAVKRRHGGIERAACLLARPVRGKCVNGHAAGSE